VLPRAYHRWLDSSFPAIPSESLATCDNCAMQKAPDVPGGERFFGPNKCCTYFPTLPSFQVGGILGEASEGAQRIAARIRNRVGIDPLAVRADRRTAELYRIGMSAGFGRAEAFRCPYYADSGACTVWPYREAVCSTYYCKHDLPVKGRAFWGAFKALLYQIELAVSTQCAHELGIAASVIDQLIANDTSFKTAADVDARADLEAHAKLWGSWLDKEEDYYRECARIADALDLPAIQRLGGLAFDRKLAAARDAYASLANKELPARLETATNISVTPVAPGTVQLLASPNQPIQLPAIVIELLSHFQGQPVADTLIALEQAGFEVDTEFITRLWECGFLVEAVVDR
jgi:hypothetical protein